ncbi:DUF1146 domain-containing protein [Hazenella sp. IB182357]|uniref:DUF1146 domain-containing protein n=1 Tax=Polycladospora coralii TaxID=2771432 RepID=A0A926RSZ8_9BACL|nr:DUF1146 family protein [Polycladospora coralii]MBD1372165.1 DUF1146 domain-containing protein [Polycladospora coralii]MBS7530664.1 DUF1146 family protein [Polycladospora coralii]
MGETSPLAISSLINICISLICIMVCWWALSGIRLEAFVQLENQIKAKALIIILSIILGHLLASFLIDYLSWSQMMGQIFSS